MAEVLRQSLADANARAAQLEANLAALQKPAVAPPPDAPDPNTDPLGNMIHQLDQVNRNVAELQAKLAEQQNQSAQMTRFQQFQQQVGQLRDTFVKTTPDFDAAYTHLRDARTADLRSFGVPDTQIATQLFQEEVALAEAAIRQGRNPAEAAYEMAKRHGYAPKAAAAPPASKLDTIRQAAGVTQPSQLPPAARVPEDISLATLKDADNATLNKIVSDPNSWAKLAGGDNIPL